MRDLKSQKCELRPFFLPLFLLFAQFERFLSTHNVFQFLPFFKSAVLRLNMKNWLLRRFGHCSDCALKRNCRWLKFWQRIIWHRKQYTQRNECHSSRRRVRKWPLWRWKLGKWEHFTGFLPTLNYYSVFWVFWNSAAVFCECAYFRSFAALFLSPHIFKLELVF